MMKLDYKNSSLVILGGWNPNIFTPEWLNNNFSGTEFITEHDPEKPDNKKHNFHFNIQKNLSINYAPVTVELNNINIEFIGTQLNIQLSNSDDLSILERFTKTLLNLVPNIPLIAFGINFLFSKDKDTEQYLSLSKIKEIFKINQNEFLNQKIDYEKYHFITTLDDYKMNVYVDINHLHENYEINLNFHFEVNNTGDILSIIEGKTISELKQKTSDLINRL